MPVGRCVFLRDTHATFANVIVVKATIVNITYDSMLHLVTWLGFKCHCDSCQRYIIFNVTGVKATV